MNIASIEFLHLQLPFRNTFQHALKSRSFGDTILVRLITSNRMEGWGEILPRDYVTGETIDGLLGDGTTSAPAARLAQSLIDTRIGSVASLIEWSTDALLQSPATPALIGGIELAWWNVLCQCVPTRSQPLRSELSQSELSQSASVDLTAVLGARRQRATGHCITIGFDATTDRLRARAISARLNGATVVKLKIGLDDDTLRIKALDTAFKGHMPIRLDANGQYDPARLDALLGACQGLAVQSVEEPLSQSAADLDALKPLFAAHRIPFIADESVCTEADAHRLIEHGGFQGFNLRVGKHGGLAATGRIRDLALASGLSVVAGSMVGESGILAQASELLLQHSDPLDYVEGLGQNERFLLYDPVERLPGTCPGGVAISMNPFRFRDEVCGDAVIARYHYGH